LKSSISINSTIIKLENAIEKGRYKSVKKEILELKKTNLEMKMLITLDLFLCRVLREMGETKESYTLSTLILDSAESFKDEKLIIEAQLENAYCNWYAGDYEKGIQICNFAQDIMGRSESDYRKLYARSQIILGNLVGDQGDLDLALKYYTDALKIYRLINDKDGIAYSLNNLGTLYNFQGNLDEALICYERSGQLFQELDNPINIAMSLGNIGYIYLEKGDLEVALDSLLRSHKILTEINDKAYLPAIETSIGRFYYSKGQYQKALSYFENSLTLFELLENNLWMSETLLYYILTFCEIDLNNTTKLLNKFEKIIESDKSNSKLIDLRFKVSKAIILKKTNRLENIVEAEKLLYQIVDNDEIIDYAVTLMAMKHLADLLILELKLNDDENILIELINLISKLNNSALIHGSHRTQVQTYILFAKLKILNGDFQSAIESLNHAEKIAKEDGLEKLVKEVLLEKEGIVEKVNMYERAYGDSSNIQEKLQQANVEAYLTEILANGLLQHKQNK